MANTRVNKPDFKRRAFRPGYVCAGKAPSTQRIMEKQKIEVCPCVTRQRWDVHETFQAIARCWSSNGCKTPTREKQNNKCRPVGMAWAVRSREDSRCPADRCPRTRRCKLPLESRTRTRSHAPIPPSTNTRRCTAHSAPSARAPRRTARPGTRGTATRWLGKRFAN
jgi:hypothetical protein